MRNHTKAAMLSLGILALWLLPGAALSHGDAAWIQQGGYLDKAGIGCCGVNDCEMIPEEMVRRTSEGWEIEGDFFADADFGRGLHASIDEHFWRCKWGGHNRRLFTSETGT